MEPSGAKPPAQPITPKSHIHVRYGHSGLADAFIRYPNHLTSNLAINLSDESIRLHRFFPQSVYKMLNMFDQHPFQDCGIALFHCLDNGRNLNHDKVGLIMIGAHQPGKFDLDNLHLIFQQLVMRCPANDEMKFGVKVRQSVHVFGFFRLGFVM